MGLVFIVYHRRAFPLERQDLRCAGGPAPLRITYPCAMTVQPAGDRPGASLEVPPEELLRRGRALPSLQQLVIEELTDDEADAFWAALNDA